MWADVLAAIASLVAGAGGQYRRLSKIDVICRMAASDIFVSYAREDQARVTPLVAALEARGWSVFWDRRIPAGQTWRSHIGRALEQARCVVVAWSEHSIRSEWVIEEADDGRERGILVPAFLDPVRPPQGFRGIQAADLSGWLPERPSPAFDGFLADLGAVLDAPGPQEASTSNAAPTPAPALPADEDAADQANAAGAPVTDCDWLAADPEDDQKRALGVGFQFLDAGRAIPACKAAVEQWPQEARFAFQYGRALEKAGNDAEAMRWYRKAAERGHARAQNKLGEAHRIAQSVAKKEAKAVRGYRRAAEQGDAEAQHSLGEAYAIGQGVAKDDAEAMRWYRKAAEQGHAGAQNKLGVMYVEGRGVAKDEAEAARWFKKAAEQGDYHAKNNLGFLRLSRPAWRRLFPPF